MSIKPVLACLSVLLVSACASAPQKTISSAALTEQQRLFPNGTYQHDIALTILEGNKTHRFNGIVKLEPEAIRVVGLGAFGITAFKITEDLKTGQVETQVYIEAMKKFAPKLTEYYRVVRPLFGAAKQKSLASPSLRWIKEDAQGRPLELETVGLEPAARYEFASYDSHGMVERMILHHPKFRAEIRVTGYDL